MIAYALCPPSRHPQMAAIKERQQKMWASGDFAVVGTTLQIVGEALCEALDLRAGESVLDVAAGNGNAALAAARRWCDVTAVDYVPALLEKAAERAAAERLPLKTQVADAEALPFAEAVFDVAVSTFGVMFAPDHARAAQEMARVTRAGGKIGLANWTPEGFLGHLFRLVGSYVSPPAGVAPPALWGTKAHLKELFDASAVRIETTKKHFVFRYRSPEHWIEVFRTTYGPTLKAYEALDADGQAALTSDLTDLLAKFNRAKDGSLAVPAEYLEAVIIKR